MFGDYISVYDIQRAVRTAHGPDLLREPAGEARAEGSRAAEDRPEFEEATEGEEVERKEKLKSKWAQLEALVGAEKRIKLIADDIVDHFENAARRAWTARR